MSWVNLSGNFFIQNRESLFEFIGTTYSVIASVNILATTDVCGGRGPLVRFITLGGEFDQSFRHGAETCDD